MTGSAAPSPTGSLRRFLIPVDRDQAEGEPGEPGFKAPTLDELFVSLPRTSTSSPIRTSSRRRGHRLRTSGLEQARYQALRARFGASLFPQRHPQPDQRQRRFHHLRERREGDDSGGGEFRRLAGLDQLSLRADYTYTWAETTSPIRSFFDGPRTRPAYPGAVAGHPRSLARLTDDRFTSVPGSTGTGFLHPEADRPRVCDPRCHTSYALTPRVSVFGRADQSAGSSLPKSRSDLTGPGLGAVAGVKGSF